MSLHPNHQVLANVATVENTDNPQGALRSRDLGSKGESYSSHEGRS